MSKLIQCVPNFSTSREETGVAIADALDSAGAAVVLDRHWDVDHARTVVTFAGSPEDVRMAMLAGAEKAVELIDMREHHGEHPRLGAIDVVPLVPLKDVTMEECVDLSYTIGRDLASNLGLPVYFYEHSAKLSHRRNLAEVRKGGFEALVESGLCCEWRPDLGPEELHPTAGACVVGARGPLIAFNVNLDSTDLAAARKVAARIREVRDSGQGMAGVKALGLNLAHRGCVQVSTNITLPDEVTMYEVFACIEHEAAVLGVAVREAELVGMVRLKHLTEAASAALGMKGRLALDAVLDYRVPHLPPFSQEG